MVGTSWGMDTPASRGERGPALRAAPVFQDGRVPRHAQPDADHALRQRHRLRHRGALRPVGPWKEVREVQLLVEGREGGDGAPGLAPSASLRLCFPLAQTMLRGKFGQRKFPSSQSPGRGGPGGC